MIDHDRAFLLDVLKVDGQTEDELDDLLKMEAKQLGVDMEPEAALGSKQSFSTYCSDYSLRSQSIDSRASHSTDLLSTSSNCSRDQTISPSFKDYDRFVSSARNSISFSPSTVSPPSSQPASLDLSPKKHFRRIRGLNLLRLHRSDSLTSLADACPHCPQDVQSQRRAMHKLRCGHRLCTQALRNTVKAAIDSRRGAVPSCCRQPIPGNLVEHVMTHEEQSALLDSLEQWDESRSPSPSMNSSRRSSLYRKLSAAHVERDAQISADGSKIMPRMLKAQEDLAKVMERDDYRLLKLGQAEQRDRFLTWVTKQRADLMVKHDQLRSDIRLRHEAVAEELQEHHASATGDAEDKQVKAELDLREAQGKERCDNATALKHLEAYCAGTYSNGESHDRVVTDQARLELEKARWHRDSMAIRHENAINVLRGEQNRRLRLRALRQDRELQDLKRQQRKEELELERSCTSELVKFNDTCDAKRRKLCWRWELQMAIFAKRIEAETGTHLDCRLPAADWPSGSTKSSLGCLSVASSFSATDLLPLRELHDSSTTQPEVPLRDPESKYDRRASGIMHVQEFKIGGL